MNDHLIEFKIYNPLTADFLPENWEEGIEFDYDYKPEPMTAEELTGYEDIIREALIKEQLPEESARGLMVYYVHRNSIPSVDEKVVSAFPDVEAYNGKLWGVMKCRLREPLNEKEFNAFKDFLRGQYSDGWLEGFEQRDIKTGTGEMNVHFWQSGRDYRLMTEHELKGTPVLNKDAFWNLIGEAKAKCGKNQKAYEKYIHRKLMALPSQASQDFHDTMQAYIDLSRCFGLWDAAGIMKEYGCSDDGFIDFRCWLISQGKETYLNALKDPDSLCNVESYEDCSFEMLCYAGDICYEKLTGKSAYDHADRQKQQKLVDEFRSEIVYAEGIEQPRNAMELPGYLPRLCEKYGVTRQRIEKESPWNGDYEFVSKFMEKTKPKEQQKKKGEKAR